MKIYFLHVGFILLMLSWIFVATIMAFGVPLMMLNWWQCILSYLIFILLIPLGVKAMNYFINEINAEEEKAKSIKDIENYHNQFKS